MRILNELMYRAKNIGKIPICNCKRERAPILFGHSFIFCWRCTSILIPLLGMRILFEDNPVFTIYILGHSDIVGILAVLLIFPTLIDGILQYGFEKESTNLRRIVTGFPAGFGLFLLKIILIH